MQPSGPRAVTIKGTGLLRELKCAVRVGLPIVGQTQPAKTTGDVFAIWDTGATGSVITQRIVDELVIAPISMTSVHGVAGTTTSPVYLVSLLLPMGVAISMVNVTRGDLPPGTDLLIGMDIITLGDFVVSNTNGRTVMSFRVPSSGAWDFVEESKLPQGNRKARRAQVRDQRKAPGSPLR